MSSINFLDKELTAAIARGVHQYVVIGSRRRFREAVESYPDQILRVFALDEEEPSALSGAFLPIQPASDAIASAVEKSEFDRQIASLFIWLGAAGCRTVEATLARLAFIASLPKGSGVVFDYAPERTSFGSPSHTALDALASRVVGAGGTVKHLIQPQAVAALLRGLGFQKIVDLAQEELSVSGGHLVSALV